jgi:cbb3-type cytochrome oxidase maturation protein
MSILYFLVPMGVLIVAGALWAFFWAVDSGQFDDLESPAWRILLDDDSRPPEEKTSTGERRREDAESP